VAEPKKIFQPGCGKAESPAEAGLGEAIRFGAAGPLDLGSEGPGRADVLSILLLPAPVDCQFLVKNICPALARILLGAVRQSPLERDQLWQFAAAISQSVPNSKTERMRSLKALDVFVREFTSSALDQISLSRAAENLRGLPAIEDLDSCSVATAAVGGEAGKAYRNFVSVRQLGDRAKQAQAQAIWGLVEACAAAGAEACVALKKPTQARQFAPLLTAIYLAGEELPSIFGSETTMQMNLALIKELLQIQPNSSGSK